MDASTTRRKARRLSSVVVVAASVSDVPTAHAAEPSATRSPEMLELLGWLVSSKFGRFADRGRLITP
jgi:hypothetical protein